jgi:hypothetical protein
MITHVHAAHDESGAMRWSFGLLGAVVLALLLFFFYVALPLLTPLD